MTKTGERIIFLLAFVEGGIILTAEMAANHLISPWLGNSVNLWSAILFSSLLGLALGYFYAGKLSSEGKSGSMKIIIPAVVITLVLMPFLSKWLVSKLIFMNMVLATFISAGILLLPLSFFCGLLSPLMIHLLKSSVKAEGKAAGIIFSVSTVGGFVFALLFGFLLVPGLGIKYSLFLLGAIFLIVFVLFQLTNKTPLTR